MSTTIRINSNRSALADWRYRDQNFSSGTTAELYLDSEMFVGYDLSALTQQQRRQAIKQLTLYTYAYMSSPYHYSDELHAASALSAWIEAELTYNNKPRHTVHVSGGYTYRTGGDWAHGVMEDAADAALLLKNGAVISAGVTVTVCTSRHANAPYLLLELENESPGRELKSASPSSGYTPKNKALSVSWYTDLTGACIDDVTVTQTVLRYRATAEDAAQEIDCGTAEAGTIPAAAITADSIQWQAETTDSLGNSVTSRWYTLSTVEAKSSATAVSPRDVMVDGSTDTTFVWTHRISTRTKATRSVIRVSADEETWTTVLDQEGSATTGTVPAGTLPSGSLLWQVQTYNSEGLAGYWSESASIMVVAAPPEPAVTVEQTPRPLVTWQSSGQQGYQIRIPDVWESGSIYGAEASYKLPVILPDGDYTVELRVVNEYKLWSGWGSAPLTVANQPGPEIQLQAATPGTVILTWSSAGDYVRYLVERDGEPIAVTADSVYADHRAVGGHSYRVLGLPASGDDYTPSNTVSVDLVIEVNSITDLETGEILSMPYSTTEIQEEEISLSRAVTLTHYAGADYPSAEIGRSRSKTMQFEAAFADLSQARRLEALIGRHVALKTKNAEIVTGILGELNKRSSAFWVDYTGELAQADDPEEVAL